MRIITRLLGGILAVIVILVGVAYLLPREVTVTRSVVIEAEPEAVFAHLASLQAAQAWSPWADRDPDMVVTFEGPESGVGNRMTWTSDQPDVGNGTQEITALVDNERVDSALDFGPRGTAEAWLDLEPVDGGTEVTWGLHTDMGMNPIGRWMGLMFDGWMGPDYETGLARLRTIVEAG